MIKIGTSGWSYNHWFFKFYPHDLPKKQSFSYYQSVFDSVELNVSFYRLVPESVYKGWQKKVSENFLFAIKASRFITHVKRLKDFEAIEKFIGPVLELKPNLGPILFQLPRNFKKDTEVLNDFIERLPNDLKYVFEFRDASWFDSETYDVLEANNIALAASRSTLFSYKEMLTADFVYVRLHGPGDQYASNYTDEELGKWADKALTWDQGGRDVYMFFNNDFEAFAPLNAIKIKELIKKKIKKAA